eukprot:CAMPEP_0113479372 /NCGR_PEP_ID=MMETSP0014_2-20120614/21273_1 /TAXON_ID=2857 /ORGANISM="Nitzschia sp." /LENGTH=1797 /DNA_ID=CAMNT_0000372663 /DNA_START=224 /DNA_END=5617 /DNA_ORIENTATION=+ /assembly_acc=CAM_ASM_000159
MSPNNNHNSMDMDAPDGGVGSSSTSDTTTAIAWRVRDNADGLLKRRSIPTRPGTTFGSSSSSNSRPSASEEEEDKSVQQKKKRREDAFFKFIRSSSSSSSKPSSSSPKSSSTTAVADVGSGSDGQKQPIATTTSSNDGGDGSSGDGNVTAVNIEQVLDDLKTERQELVRKAFDIGAKCCVERTLLLLDQNEDGDADDDDDDEFEEESNMEKKNQAEDKNNIKKEEGSEKKMQTDPKTESNATGGGEKNKKKDRSKYTPETITDVKHLQQLRLISMERAHDNRDMGRRRLAVAKEQEQLKHLQKLQNEKQKKQQQQQQQRRSQNKEKSKTPTTSTKAAAAAPTAGAAVPDNVTSTNTGKKTSAPASVAASTTTTTPTTTNSTTTTPSSDSQKGQKAATAATPGGNTSKKDTGVKQAVKATSSATEPSKTTSSPATPKEKSKQTGGPTGSGLRKFTRNTIASTSSALDARHNASRATICTTANIVFAKLTPPVNGVEDVVTDIPQNPAGAGQNSSVADDGAKSVEKQKNDDAAKKTAAAPAGTTVNMGAVVVEAQHWAKRIVNVAENSTRRSQRRMQYRKDNVYYDNIQSTVHSTSINLNNNANNVISDNDDDTDTTDRQDVGRRENKKTMGEEWEPPVLNPFAWTVEDEEKDKDQIKSGDNNTAEPMEISPPLLTSSAIAPSSHNGSTECITESWEKGCVPRLLSIFQTGVGHGIVHDVQWSTRHGRIANLLQNFAATAKNTPKSVLAPTSKPSIDCNSSGGDAVEHGNYGLHLIVTVQPDVEPFMKEFSEPLIASTGSTSSPSSSLSSMNTSGEVSTPQSRKLRALAYGGTKDERRRLRKKFGDATGLAKSAFHVILVSYTDFIQDFIHFCQIPFDVVVLDDGVSWMKVANSNPACNLGKIWEDGIFSQNDHSVGLAGTSHEKNKEWEFDKDEFDEETRRDAWIGLTARHRLATSSRTFLEKNEEVDLLPIESLLNFVNPQFFGAIKEEWDRSKISLNPESIDHFQKLIAKSMVVHDSNVEMDQSNEATVFNLSLDALKGLIRESDAPSKHPKVPEVLMQEPSLDDNFACEGKVAQSRRSVLQWLGEEESSWLRYELGKADFQPILNAMKASNFFGYVCEEVITASSTTNAGAAGQIAGGLAFRPALRCGKCFGYEPGLRQHLSLYHATPGTWLCRTCGMDCGTSQARTHHERSCGQPIIGTSDAPKAGGSDGGTKGAKKAPGPSGTVGKKKQKTGGAPKVEERDPDGSIRVPTYRGVWVNAKGEYFLKVDTKRWTNEGDDKIVYFQAADEAAKKYDSILDTKKAGEGAKKEYNFIDGQRIVYDDGAKSAITGVGGNSSNVVAKLSVINIKNLPPDVKPLLRDPRQISRTGGNSKRHVYAYRGVCRQTRKSNDRWQSQISFLGVNHYLGTFESEWDAAAIYAWAHLILYGEEATLQAQKEGEEAAAAYEKEKRDIAAGIIPAPAPKPAKPTKVAKPKPEKKPKEKKKPGPKPGPKKVIEKKPKEKKVVEKKAPVPAKKPKPTRQVKKRPAPPDKSAPVSNKKGRSNLVDRENINPLLGKSVLKAAALVPSTDYAEWSDQQLIRQAAANLSAARGLNYCVTEVPVPAPVHIDVRPCIPVRSAGSATLPVCATLVGLDPTRFGWDLDSALSKTSLLPSSSTSDRQKVENALNAEYGPKGVNVSFQTLAQGGTTVIGCASRRMVRVYKLLGLGPPPVGGCVGNIDCNIGGDSSCSESAAVIRFSPDPLSDKPRFTISRLSKNDTVCVNGKEVDGTREVEISHKDVCTIGARVFAFLLPSR